jgi:hypothetical protein
LSRALKRATFCDSMHMKILTIVPYHCSKEQKSVGLTAE